MDEIGMFTVLRPPPPEQAEQIRQRARARLDPALTAAASPARGDLAGSRHRLVLFGTGRKQRGRDIAARLVLLRRSRLAVVTGGLAMLAAAAVIAVQVASPGTARRDGGLAVRELAFKTAAAAAAGPQIRPGQWVYWQLEQGNIGWRLLPRRQMQLPVWMTADPTRAAYRFHGKLVYLRPSRVCIPHHGCHRFSQFIEPPNVVLFHGQPAISAGQTGRSGWVSYAALSRLPRSPRALDRYLSRLPSPFAGARTVSLRAFRQIEQLLTSYVMPPRLTAELYLALGDLPAVSVDRHVVDLAGRPGMAFVIRMPDPNEPFLNEIIVSRADYRLLGTESVWVGNGKFRTVREEEAILRRALVPGPGISP